MGEGERVRHLVEQVEAGQFDALEAVADKWAASAGVKQMSAAIASVFEQHASQEIMDRFREKVAALMHLAFVEGAAQGVLQVKPVLDAGPRNRAAPIPAPTEWQPIETAPRDGSWFFTKVEGADDYAYDVARFEPGLDDFVKAGCGFSYVTHWRPAEETGGRTDA